MIRETANKKMKDRGFRSLWITEALGCLEDPKSTKYHKGLIYVVWPKHHYRWGKDEAEIYDTSNIYGECENVIALAEYKKMKEYTPAEVRVLEKDDADEQFAALHVAHHKIVDLISDISIARYTQDQFRAIVALINATAMDEFWKKAKDD